MPVRPAGAASCQTVDRDQSVELVPRRKRLLDIGEACWLLHVVRRVARAALARS
jgi:hypothetical protein